MEVTTELELMKAQIAQLQREVSILKWQRWSGLGICMLGLIAVTFRATSQAVPQPTSRPVPTRTAPAKPPQDLICKSLTVVGSDGTKRAVIGVDANGGTIVVSGNNGKSRLKVAVGEYGGYVNLYGNDAKLRLLNGVNKDGGVLKIAANDAKPRILQMVSQNGGLIDIYGNGSKSQLLAGATGLGGRIVVFDDKGNQNADFP